MYYISYFYELKTKSIQQTLNQHTKEYRKIGIFHPIEEIIFSMYRPKRNSFIYIKCFQHFQELSDIQIFWLSKLTRFLKYWNF